MAKSIDFVVRNSAGGLARGQISATPSNNVIRLGVGDEISINLARQSIVGYSKTGNDLVLDLIDGRQIKLGGYFNSAGEANQLYVSQGGEIVAVDFASINNGPLYASYDGATASGKYSAYDGLRFFVTDDLALAAGAAEEEATAMAAFVPGIFGLGSSAAVVGAGIIGGALIGGSSGGGGGGTSGRRPPSVDAQADRVIIIATPDKKVTLTGGGEPGDQVSVLIGGVTQTTTIGSNGKWEVSFPSGTLTNNGQFKAEVTFTQPDGTVTKLDGLGLLIDLIAPNVAVVSGAKSTADIENLVEYEDGITITGTGEIGAKIVVTVSGFSHSTVVGANGSWAVTFPTTQLPPGEYERALTVVATDVNGNQTVLNDHLVVDTQVNPFSVQSVATGADTVINGSEARAGVQVSGQVEVGATVTVYFAGGIALPATVNALGGWSVIVPTSQIPLGEKFVELRAVATDRAGNVSVATQQVEIDTLVNMFSVTSGKIGGDGVLNAAEVMAGVTLSGMVEVNSRVEVTLSSGHTKSVFADTNGHWSVTFNAVDLPRGEQKITYQLKATDAAGNTATLGGDGSLSFMLDTQGPQAPTIIHDIGSGNLLTGAYVSQGETNLEFFSIGSGNVARPLEAEHLGKTSSGAHIVEFSSAVPDGSFLVVRDSDLANNTASTLYIRNTGGSTVTIDPNMTALKGFNFGTIDLTSASGSLTLDATSLKALTGYGSDLKVMGDGSDYVRLNGATLTGTVQGEGDNVYEVYSLGSGRVLIDTDIHVSLI